MKNERGVLAKEMVKHLDILTDANLKVLADPAPGTLACFY